MLGPARDGGQLDVPVAGLGDPGAGLVGASRSGTSSRVRRGVHRRAIYVRGRRIVARNRSGVSLQDLQPRVGHVEHALGRPAARSGRSRRSSSTSASARRSPPSTTASRSRRCSSSTARRDVGRRLERHARLALAPALEPLLARPAGAMAAVDVAACRPSSRRAGGRRTRRPRGRRAARAARRPRGRAPTWSSSGPGRSRRARRSPRAAGTAGRSRRRRRRRRTSRARGASSVRVDGPVAPRPSARASGRAAPVGTSIALDSATDSMRRP